MADVKKKIDIEVKSNISKETENAKKLNTELNKTDKTMKSISGNSQKVSGDMKNVADAMKTLTKSIDKMRSALKDLNEINASVIKSTKALQRVTAKTTGANISTTQKLKEAKKEKDAEAKREYYKTNTLPYIRQRVAKEKETAEHQMELDAILRRQKAIQTTAGTVSRAFESGSLLNIGSTILNTLAANILGTYQNKMADKLGITRIKVSRAMGKQDEIIEDPTKRIEDKDRARQRKRIFQEKLNQQETATKKANARLTFAATVISAVVNTVAKTLNYFGNVVKQTTGITVGLRDNMNNLLTSVGSVLSLKGGAATFSSGSTLYTNATARTQQMKYGLSAGANYALLRTKGLMGMETDEDLMYMNKPQQRLFSAMMEKYTAWYSKLESSGVLARVQEAQMDLQILKEEIVMDFMEWFSENKDEILNGIKAIAKLSMMIAQGVLKVTGFLGKAFGWMGSGGTVSQTMGTYSAYSDNLISRQNKVTNININMNNTATGVLSSQQGMEDFFSEQMAKISKELALQLE